MLRRAIGFGTVVAAACFGLAGEAGAAQHQNGAAYAFWGGSPSQTLTQSFVVEELAPTSFAANFFDLTDGLYGYVGVQRDGLRWDGSVGDLAIFSLWGSVAEMSSPPLVCSPEGADCTGVCNQFGGEGDGLSCRAPFTIESGDRITLSVSKVPRATTDTWVATATNHTSGLDVVLGQIAFSSDQGLIGGSTTNFVEYFGEQTPCGAVPTSSVLLEAPGREDATDTYGGSGSLNCAGPQAGSVLQSDGRVRLILGGLDAQPVDDGLAALAIVVSGAVCVVGSGRLRRRGSGLQVGE